MDFGKAFTYAFEDQDWLKKLGIAGLLLLIPIFGILAVMGWTVEITRRVIQREAVLLPEWSGLGDFFMKGLKLWVIAFVYSLPVILLSICQQVPLLFLQDSGDDTVVAALGVLTFCFSCVMILFGIVLGFVLPAAFARFAATGDMKAAFKFGEVIGLVRSAPQAYLIVLLGSIVSSFVASLGVILCVIGMIFTYAYAMAVNAHFWGQAYNQAGGPQEVVEATF